MLARQGIKPHNVRLPGDARVMIHGLSSSSSQQYNKKWGRLEAWDSDSSRYVVEIEEGRLAKIKPENIRT